MHPFDKAGRRHMEYIRQRGSFDDLPLDQIMADVRRDLRRRDDRGRPRPGSAAAAGDDAFAAS